MYVWFDALANYITALGYGDNSPRYKEWWEESDERIHFVGKGINRFHTVYWPAMLLSAGLPLPTHVFVHGYLTVDGQKMSKSLGNVVDPEELVREYGTDAVRHFFLRHTHPFEDTDFTLGRFKEAYNADLANGLGNLTSRIMKLAESNLTEPIMLPSPGDFPNAYTKSFERFEFNRASDAVWERIQAVDEDVATSEPYKVVKTDPQRGADLIRRELEELYWIGRMLNPLLPDANVKVKEAVATNRKPETLFARKA